MPPEDPIAPGLDETIQRFLDKIWTTKGARFNAHRRLLARHKSSTKALAVLSIYVIAASIGSLVVQFEPVFARTYSRALPAIGAGTIVVSVFILVQSLLDSAQNYQLRAHQMLRCGEKLSSLYNRLSAKRNMRQIGPEEYLLHVEEYDRILQDYSENHEDIDYLLLLSKRNGNDQSRFGGTVRWLGARWYGLQNLVHIWGGSMFFMLSPVVVGFLVWRMHLLP